MDELLSDRPRIAAAELARPRARLRVLALVNTGGRAAAAFGREALRDRVAGALVSAGAQASVRLVEGGELPDALEKAMSTASTFDVLAVGGGDGTISTAAGHLAGTDIPLGVLPLGTLNHFAKDLGIPDSLDMACATIAAGHARNIDVADVNGRVFVNNSSIGIYPYMLEARDVQRRTLGLGKWGAMALACVWMLRRFPLRRLTIRSGGGARERRTPCVFIGNNCYAVEGPDLGTRDALDRGTLCLYVARSHSRLHFLLLMLKAVMGRMAPLQDLDAISAETLTIESRARRLRVALDGEIAKIAPPLHYRVRRGALRVIVPRAR
jgi:diacylglycerol kinase family enzyme